VHLYEDQILRGKDMSARAELARKVARMWEQELTDPREAADAWRRVLRMKQGDAEATSGLERAKANMLKKPVLDGDLEPQSAAKVPQTSAPPPPPPEPEPARDAESPTVADVPSVPPPVAPLAATLRAALATEPEVSPSDEVTANSSHTVPAREPEESEEEPKEERESGEEPDPDEEESEDLEHTFAPDLAADELLRESAQLAGRATDSKVGPLPEPVQAAPLIDHEEPSATEDDEGDFEEEVIIADDLAEVVDVEDDAVSLSDEPVSETQPKRSIPPPIPRH
jgi:hypothetical protein